MDIVERLHRVAASATEYELEVFHDHLMEAKDEIERLAHDIERHIRIAGEQAGEIERLTELKTPASRQLLNITKGAWEHAEAENERLRAALQRIDGINDNPACYNSA